MGGLVDTLFPRVSILVSVAFAAFELSRKVVPSLGSGGGLFVRYLLGIHFGIGNRQPARRDADSGSGMAADGR